MNNLTSKLTALLLVAVMIFTLSANIFAAVPEENTVNACSHVYTQYGTKTLAEGKGVYYSDNTCYKTYNVKYKCSKCGNIMSSVETDGYPTNHKFNVFTATCNGTIQDVLYRCRSCYHSYHDYPTCPRDPHTGPCNWLPG